MEYPVEEILSYPLPALFVLAVFYGIYFAKMLAQKRRGIRTRQIGQRKEKSIHTVELLMSMATLGVVIAQLVTIAFGWSCLAANARFTGFVIGMLGDLIFLLSVLCMNRRLRNAKSRINTAFFVVKIKYLLKIYGKIELRETINQST